MKQINWVIGMSVYIKWNRACNAELISLPDSDNNVKILSLDDRSIFTFNVNDIGIPDEESEKLLISSLQNKIDESVTAFEKAFETLKAIKSAHNDQDIDFRWYKRSNLIDLSVLESTLENSGWSSSSIWC